MNKRNNKKKSKGNNRINFITAIVFLCFIFFLYCLYDIQVMKHQFFSTLASSQHGVNSELVPDRGSIFIQGEKGNLYPMATNKDFAFVYAVPKDIEDAEEASQKLFEFFDREGVRKKAKEYFEKKDKDELNSKLEKVIDIPKQDISDEERRVRIKEIRDNFFYRRNTGEWLEKRQKEKEEFIEEETKKILEEYNFKLNKKNDPYEPLKKKVELDDLKDMYAFLSDEDVSGDDMRIKNGRIYIEKDEEEELFEFPGFGHFIKESRYYPEENTGSHILGFTKFKEDDLVGNYGLEGFFDNELSGKPGYLVSGDEEADDEEKIMLDGKVYKKAIPGDDLVLTIDRSIQFYICSELEESAKRHGADGGSVLAISPRTGAIIAMCSWPDFNPNKYNEVEEISVFNNPVIFDEYEPGSVFKAITMGIALNENKVTPHTLFQDKGTIKIGKWNIKNSDFHSNGAHGLVDMNYVLEESLNTGAIFAMRQVGSDTFVDYVKEFGFGEKTGIELEAESDGNIRNLAKDNVSDIYAATVSFGQGMTATPLQIAMSYSAIANNGTLMKPYLIDKIIYPDGVEDITKPVQVKKVISEEASVLLSGMLVNVIEGGHAKKAGVEGYYLGGKTGTAEVAASGSYGGKTIHTFVGMAPIDDPKFVMLVKLDDPKDVKYAASSAAPLFGKIADFMLKYYEIPKTR